MSDPLYMAQVVYVANAAYRAHQDVDILGLEMRQQWQLLEKEAKIIGYDVFLPGDPHQLDIPRVVVGQMRKLTTLLYRVDPGGSPDADHRILQRKNDEYGGSWCSRGGQGAFMMLARKWDRIEHQVWTTNQGSLRQAMETDQRQEGILDDIGDLRRYLILCLAWHEAQT